MLDRKYCGCIYEPLWQWLHWGREMYWDINFSNSTIAAWVCNIIIIIIIFKCAATVLSHFSIASQQEHWGKRVNILPEFWFTDGFSLHAVHSPHFCINGLFSSTFCTLLTKSEMVALQETAVLQHIKQWLKWLILGKAQWYLWKETGNSKSNSAQMLSSYNKDGTYVCTKSVVEY